MVFDVAAVEIEDLGQHLRRAGRAAEVLERSLLRRDAYDRVRRDHPRRHGESDDDWIERVALAFWALDLSCVFLDASGHCSVYEHRPQSCRRFFVFGPAEFCAPAAAADPRRLARMSEPGTGEEIDDLLRRLDRRVPFDPEDDRLDHALTRWLQHRSVH
jgi:Fe-S-cluster containining protein